LKSIPKRLAATSVIALVAIAAAVAPASANPGPLGAERAAEAATAAALGLGSGEALQARSVVVDADGTRHVRYDRTLDGLAVVGGDLVVEKSASGSVRATRGQAAKGLGTVAKKVSVSSAAAIATARKQTAYTPTATTATQVIWAGDGTARIAWDVRTVGTRADQTPSRQHVYVDARTGAVIETQEEIADGSGTSKYNGTVTIGTSGSTGAFQLKDALGHTTSDLNGATSGTGTLMTDADDVWGQSTYTTTGAGRQAAGVDAQYGAEMTYNFYLNTFGRKGIWNTGKAAPSRVHYGNAYVNAFWDGTQMTYGDGSNNVKPLTSLDVAGHEMSHGVTENTAALVYSGESGGLNEATSDIFGTAVEWSANNAVDKGDYLIGEMIDINGNGTPLRYMDQPSKDGSSANCWSSKVGRLNVHYSSGPLNHWYYLVSEGSGAKTVNGVSYNSPTCNGGTVTGVGHTVAEAVWYRTLTTKLTSRSGYAAAREGAIASAKELYGKGSAQCLSVEAAMNAISAPKGTQTCTN